MASSVRAPEEKQYNLLENVFNYINREVIALEDRDVKRNNILLSVITEKLIEGMKKKNVLFKALYKKKYYGGSYYDNLKVGAPNEYDLDLILSLPVIVEPYVISSDQPGFVEVRLKNYGAILHRPEAERKLFEDVKYFLDNPHFLSTKKVLEWFEGVFTKALNELEKGSKDRKCIEVVLDRTKPQDTIKVYLKVNKGIPAFTLNVTGTYQDGSDIKMDIDLVPCFQFDERHWPAREDHYVPNPSTKKHTFLVVPKKPKEEHLAHSKTIERYWRLSFQEQEREMIGQGRIRLKPSLRLLKKLRDKYSHNIASYFIKTVYLLALEEMDEAFWSKPLSFVFITMLKKYESRMRANCIPYYWNRRYNLIGCLKMDNNETIANTLKNIINDIEKGLMEHPVDFYAVGQSLLTNEEYNKLRRDLPLTQKQKKYANNVRANHELCQISPSCVDSKRRKSLLTCLGIDPQLEHQIKHLCFDS